jgi:hypothetical protein
VILYATWPDCEREHIWVDPEAQKLWQKLKKATGKKASKLQKQLNGCKQDRAILLGKSIKVERGKASYEGDRGPGTGNKLSVHHLVAGHWKKQPCGERRKERKLIWVSPYWRGPEDGPLREAVHVLK